MIRDEVEPGIAVPDPCEKAHCQASLSYTMQGYGLGTSCASVETLMDSEQAVHHG